ncbi:NACHT, LRR and PYD domains-containing protein 1-like [Engraulis encrasicolus]|uniref:NACHT, LRR and PYD domains-containing protein 1-like n=1 Tax=Engraulis encrasicolus TaxID=184585 RepID=UPI002FD0786F
MDEPEIREMDPPPEERAPIENRPDSPVSKRVKWSMDHPAPSRETDPPPAESVQLGASDTQKMKTEQRDTAEHSVQQGASDTQNLTTGKTKIDTADHRLTPEEAELRSFLKEKCQHLVEGVPHQGDSRLLYDVYTELYITEGGSAGVNEEHEVRQIDRASCSEEGYDRPIKCSDMFKPLCRESREVGYDRPIKYSDIFKPLYIERAPMSDESDDIESEEEYENIEGEEGSDDSEGEEDSADRPIHCSGIFRPLYPQRGLRQHKPIRVVLTKGVAGIGKTVSVQKFILDWAEGETNQDIHFIFPLPFRELNLMKKIKLSLVELIQHFFPQIEDLKVLSGSEYKTLFIFDGLDECRLPLNFCSKPRCCEVTEPASVDVLLTNLINGNLLPSALVWITTRPAAAGQIPPECVDQVTEIRGFNDQQKDDYFKKRISDENLAMRVIRHLKSSRSLYIMCHIPVFAWILAAVAERTSERGEMPRTLAQMYTHFLNIQTCIKKEKYTERRETDEEMVLKLGKLAFQQLEKGNLIFYEEDLRASGIDVTEASLYSGLCTQIFRVKAGLCHGRVFSFVHLTIQEFLAALYVFLCFRNSARNKPHQHQPSHLSALFRAATLEDLHKTVVDLALQSQNGHLDLFLRFLLGLSLESNQKLLRHLRSQINSEPQSLGQTVQYVKDKIRHESESDRKINLFYCLNELNQHAVVECIDRSSGALSVEMLLPGKWMTRKFRFELSEEQRDGFDLQKYIKTPEEDLTDLLRPDDILKKLMPALSSALLVGCSLTEKSCAAIAAAARSTSCSLKWLQLSWNELRDEGVQHLSDLLKNPQCKLETLELMGCSLTEKSCAAIAAAARSTSCSLKWLQLSWNELRDEGVQHLSDLLKNPQCKLETLELEDCSLTEKSCATIAAAAISTSCRLKRLQLSENQFHDTDIKHLSDLLKNPQCKLETLEVGSHSDGSLRVLIREIPAAAAYSSSSLSSDDAELYLTHNTQKHPGAQRFSLHTPTEDGPSDDTQKGCECCADVPDTSHWVLVEPDVSTEKSISTYSLSSAAGSYECSESRLRLSCGGPVTLQYRFMDWYVFADELANMQCSPAGPLMDIKLMLGEVKDIHLPHFLCLGGCQSALKNVVKVLHQQGGGVYLETCELSRSHTRLVNPSFSIFGNVFSDITSWLFGNLAVHAKVLVYRQSSISHQEFRCYLLPEDPHLKDKVKEEEKEFGGDRQPCPHPKNSLWINKFYSLCADQSTDCIHTINPNELKLRYCRDLPELFQVKLPEPAPASLHLQLFSSASRGQQAVWSAEFQTATVGRQTRSRDLTEAQQAVGQAEIEETVPPPQGTAHASSRGLVSTLPRGAEPADTHTAVDQAMDRQDVQTPECSSRALKSSARTQTVDLFSTFDELRCKELKLFKAYLSEKIMEGCEPIPRGQLKLCDETELASKMTERYGKEGAVRMTLTILRKMELNNLASTLECNKHITKDASGQGLVSTPPSEPDSADTHTAVDQAMGRQDVQTPESSSRVLKDNVDVADFLKRKMSDLIQRVTNVMQLADGMLSEDLISAEQYRAIDAKLTDQDKMRCIFDALRSCGPTQRKKFFSILQHLHPSLLQELGWR